LLEEDSVQLQKRQMWLSLAAVAATDPGLVRLELLLTTSSCGRWGKLAAVGSASLIGECLSI